MVFWNNSIDGSTMPRLCEGRNRNGRQSCGCWPTLPLPRLALGLVAQRAWTATSWGVRCDIGLGQEMSRDVKSDFQSNLCHYVLNSSKFEGLNLNIQSPKSSLVKACPARNIPFTVWAKKFADRAAHTQPEGRQTTENSIGGQTPLGSSHPLNMSESTVKLSSTRCQWRFPMWRAC